MPPDRQMLQGTLLQAPVDMRASHLSSEFPSEVKLNGFIFYCLQRGTQTGTTVSFALTSELTLTMAFTPAAFGCSSYTHSNTVKPGCQGHGTQLTAASIYSPTEASAFRKRPFLLLSQSLEQYFRRVGVLFIS